MEVIVLAGGLGTRLRKVVSEVPKCMAPIHGKPFLGYLLDYLCLFNVERAVLSVGYKKESVKDWIMNLKKIYPFDIDFAEESEPLGTGGGIRLALSKTKDKDVIVINGDTFFNVDLDDFIDKHKKSGSKISIALKPMTDFDRYGNVLLSEKGEVTEFKEKAHCDAGLINGGIYAIHKSDRLFDNLPRTFSFEKEILQPLAAQSQISGFVSNVYFIDIGIPEGYARSQRELPEARNNMQLADTIAAGYDTLLLDRDGVINRLRPDDYVKSWSEFEFMPAAKEALARVSHRYRHIFLVTNQRGVGKGLMSIGDLNDIHERMLDEIRAAGGRIDRIYCCTALSEDDPDRKPNPGMFLKIRKDYPDITPEKTIMLGDSESDMKFARNCGIKGIKIRIA